MARRRSSRPLAPPLDRATGLRYALLHTIPGRLIVIGLAIRLALVALAAIVGGLPTFFSVIDTVAGLAIAIGATYFLYRLFVTAKTRLLWRVRRKLVVSYIFIGFIPAVLIVSFFLLGGFLLFYNLSSYLMQNRLRELGDDARAIAQSTALEIQRAGGRDVAGILARRQAQSVQRFPGIAFAVVPATAPCAGSTPAGGAARADAPDAQAIGAGPWAHVDLPQSMPAWVPCSGFGGLVTYSHPAPNERDGETHILVRGAAFPDSPRPTFAVVVDIVVNGDIRERLRADSGVELGHLTVMPDSAGQPVPGRADADSPASSSVQARTPVQSVSSLPFTDWVTGKPGMLMAQIRLSISDIYDRISVSKGLGNSAAGQNLLIVLLKLVGGLFLVIEILALGAGLALAKSITGSVHELFVGTGRVRQGDFTHKIAVKADDQLGELAESFNSMTASIEDLLQQAAEKKRLEEELRIAHEIQMSLLPQGPLEMPGLSVSALCVPAREVGGDYYDFLPLADERVGVLIADVSGKGTSAALYMAELKGLILSLSRIHSSPRELLIDANLIIREHLDARSFITVTYAIIDMRMRTMTYARAGHTPLIYVPGPGALARRVRILAPEGMVLGLKLDNGEMFERLLEEETIPLNPGDLYLFFTDGISEAMNEVEDCFGENRLGELAQEHAHLPSSELRERVLREIEAFVGSAPQHDDMTMILLKVDEAAVGAVAGAVAGAAAGTAAKPWPI